MPRPPRISRKSDPDLKQESAVRVRFVPHKKKRAAPPPVTPAPVLTAIPLQETGRQGFTLHAAAAVAAIVAVVVLSQGALKDGASSLTASLIVGERIEIGLEHTKPVTLSLSFTTNGAKGVMDIRHDALETVYVSLPSTWTKREVGGVPLTAVTSDPPSFGFTRWSVPAGALVSFDVTPPATILLHNPSGIPAEIRLTRVDLTKNAVERDIILVQEGSALLW
ncbi:MAG: hypothetical protein Q7S29_02365 [Candidatus Peribacter sp.]|nr:hypothetical protein [Candidatus Peribacter sp.]